MEPFGIILNLDRPNARLTPGDLALLRQTIKMAFAYDSNDQTYQDN